MKQGGNISTLKKEALKILEAISSTESERDAHRRLMLGALKRLPNLLHDSVPYGLNETDNVEIKKRGKQPIFDFQPLSHVEIATRLGIVDFDRASKTSGAGFYFLRNELALLDYALMRFAIDNLLAKGYSLIEPPYMLRRKPYEGVTDLADFEDVMYKVEGEDLYLIATSEHSMGAMFMDEQVQSITWM